MSSISKNDLAGVLAEEHGIKKSEASAIITSLFEQIATELAAGQKVSIANFGTIVVRDRPARMGRNPQSGEPMRIKASRKIVFRASKVLKEAVV